MTWTSGALAPAPGAAPLPRMLAAQTWNGTGSSSIRVSPNSSSSRRRSGPAE